MVVCLPVGMKFLVERYKFFEERIPLGVRAWRVVKRKRAEAQMQLAHTLEERKVLNVLRLDLVGQSIVVFALAKTTFIFRHGRSIVGQMMLVGDGLDLCGHFFDLLVSESLNTEIVVFLNLILDELVFSFFISILSVL